jgi:RNA-dependent RNA polymerase
LEPLNHFVNQRSELLNHRGYSDFAKPILPPPVRASALKSDQGRDSDTEEEDSDQEALKKSDDIDREDEQGSVNISALEALEILVPASLLQIGFLESPHTMRVLWQTSTQLSIAAEEITPRLNILWTRHTVRYQFRNILRNLSSPMWVETDLGMPSMAAASEDSASGSQKSSDGDLNGATYLDLFMPVDSVPRLSCQEHFQNHKVGSPDFTLNGDMASMTLIRLHFDLTSLEKEAIVHLMVLCRSMVELGLLKMRFEIPSEIFLPSALNANVASSASLKARTNTVKEKEPAYKLPVALVNVDHWVRWKLACLASSNAIRLSQVTEGVVALLMTYPHTIAFRILEKLESKHERLFSFEQILRTELSRYPKGDHMSGQLFELKKDFVLIAHVTVTPWEIRCEGPLPEISNRLLRNYDALKERFVRLSFRGGFIGGQTGGSMRNVGKMTVRKCCGSVLQNGLVIPALTALFESPYRRWMEINSSKPVVTEFDYRAFSRFEFLVSSPSQLRTQKAWLYCPPCEAPKGFKLPIQVSEIRKWLGDFEGIFNVAMYSARLGQGLSSTYHCFDIDPSWIRRIPDLTFEKYCFSDGCAGISMSIARRAAEALNLKYVPAAFQIRLGGIKGMVSVDTRLEGDVICVRPSMEKFLAPNHVAFEVVGWSRPLAAHLNKQIIQILSALGLPDKNLVDVQTAAFERIAASTFPSAFRSEEERTQRINELERAWGSRVKKDSLEARAIEMLRCGFNPSKEPFLKSVLTSIALRSLQDIHSMARIPIVNGRYAIGIMDEYGVLEPGQVYFAASPVHGAFDASTALPHVHTGTLCVSRSPCLHPGDARFVTAVDVPELAHLKDVIVFPQKGARPIPDECSGGDLDGDQYLILWGDEFMAPIRDTPAFEHETSSSASKAGKDDNEVYPHELVDFFINYIFDDKLSSIADAHTYWADKSEQGVFDPKCLRLAAAHNIAVDAPKTGKTVPPMDELRIASWPDFMNVNKASYISTKVLGTLYRRSDEEFSSIASWTSIISSDKDDSGQKTGNANPSRALQDSYFDKDLVVPGSEDFLEEASRTRDEYFHQLCTNMQLFGVHDEASAITGDTLYRFRSERRDWESKKEGYEFTNSDLRKRIRSFFFQIEVPNDTSDMSTAGTSDPSGQDGSNGELTENLDSGPSSQLSQAPCWTLTQLQRASAWYQVTYDPKWRAQGKLNMWSFPWLVDDILCHIKRECTAKASQLAANSATQTAHLTDAIEQEPAKPLLPAFPIAPSFSLPSENVPVVDCDVILPPPISPVGV